MTTVFFRKNKKKLLASILVLAIICTITFIFSNSLKSSEQSSNQSSQIAQGVKPIVDPSDKIPFNVFEHHIRKLAHFSEFCLLGFELFWLFCVICDGYKNITFTRYVFLVFLTLVFALIDETLQLISQRGSAVTDVWIDFSGAIIGTLIAFLISLFSGYLISQKKKKQLQSKNKDIMERKP